MDGPIRIATTLAMAAVVNAAEIISYQHACKLAMAHDEAEAREWVVASVCVAVREMNFVATGPPDPATPIW